MSSQYHMVCLALWCPLWLPCERNFIFCPTSSVYFAKHCKHCDVHCDFHVRVPFWYFLHREFWMCLFRCCGIYCDFLLKYVSPLREWHVLLVEQGEITLPETGLTPYSYQSLRGTNFCCFTFVFNSFCILYLVPSIGQSFRIR